MVLPAEILQKVLLLIPNDIEKLVAVNKNWKRALTSSLLWKDLIQIGFQFQSRDLFGNLKSFHLLRASSSMAGLASDGYLLGQELKTLTLLMQDPVDLIDSCLRVSSQDHPEQGIEETINDSQLSFWSSKGSSFSQVSDFLEYKLVGPGCLVSQIEIKPFLARYQPGLPTYASRYVSFVFSTTDDFSNPHYRSKVYPLRNENGIVKLNSCASF